MVKQYKHIVAAAFLTAIAVPVQNLQATQLAAFTPDYYGPIIKSTPEPATYAYSLEQEQRKFSVNGKLSKNSRVGNDNRAVRLSTSYSELFSPSGNGYLGFSHLSGRMDSKNKMQINTSIGRYLPSLNSELFFSYRLFGAEVASTFDTLGYGEDYAYENSFAATYTTFLDSFLREASIRYSYSFLPGLDIRENSSPVGITGAKCTQYVGGFSDRQFHTIETDLAFGVEQLPLEYLHGMKVDLGFGYEHVSHSSYYDVDGDVLEGISGKAIIQQQTVLGLVKGSYKLGQTSATLSASLDLGNVELYMKDTDSYQGDDTRVYGVSLNMDFEDLSSIFSSQQTALFSTPTKRYTSLDQAHHYSGLTANGFTKAPTMQETTTQLVYAKNDY